MATHWDLLKDCIPSDHARQVNAEYYLEEAMSADDPPRLVMDLGCGTGSSAQVFRRYLPDVRWVGVDIAGSPESAARRGVPNVVHYDGVHLPFPDRSFPLVYSHQVLEHVRHPVELLAEVHRVLAPRGLFIGSTSQFEPYHSFSLWNFTLYGFRELVEEAGLVLEEIRPSIDGFTLMRRAYTGRQPEWSRYFVEESPLNQEIDAWAEASGRRPQLVNNRKLEYCGQFAFRVRRPTSTS